MKPGFYTNNLTYNLYLLYPDSSVEYWSNTRMDWVLIPDAEAYMWQSRCIEALDFK